MALYFECLINKNGRTKNITYIPCVLKESFAPLLSRSIIVPMFFLSFCVSVPILSVGKTSKDEKRIIKKWKIF